MFKFHNTYSALPDAFYQKIFDLRKVKNPSLVLINDQLLKDLGLDLSLYPDNDLADILSGSRWIDGMTPLAMAYAGHQFGHFVPSLGDGRAMLLGEFLDSQNTRYDLHLKGSGKTMFSRRGDGLCALGPALREFIISEYMYNVQIPTTRSLSVVLTGEMIEREIEVPSAVLGRVAKSHIRIGSFEYFAARKDYENLERLLKYSIQRLYPELLQNSDQIFNFWKAVGEKLLNLVFEWMRVGFIHGVMNTDNMNISGETIDFGPCAFMDHFKFKKTFSSIDHQGRYAYGNQPTIVLWNMARLAEALFILDESKKTSFEEQLKLWEKNLESQFINMISKKLGLYNSLEDNNIILQWLLLLEKNGLDFTQSFLDLERLLKDEKIYQEEMRSGDFKKFFENFKSHVTRLDCTLKQMEENNPIVIPRNHLIEDALSEANQLRFQKVHNLLHDLKKPYDRSYIRKKKDIPPKAHEVVQKTFCGT